MISSCKFMNTVIVIPECQWQTFAPPCYIPCHDTPAMSHEPWARIHYIWWVMHDGYELWAMSHRDNSWSSQGQQPANRFCDERKKLFYMPIEVCYVITTNRPTDHSCSGREDLRNRCTCVASLFKVIWTFVKYSCN